MSQALRRGQVGIFMTHTHKDKGNCGTWYIHVHVCVSDYREHTQTNAAF